jgi:hypothetical protein
MPIFWQKYFKNHNIGPRKVLASGDPKKNFWQDKHVWRLQIKRNAKLCLVY